MAQRRDKLVVAFGVDKPPFVFGREERGLEVDIVREALKQKGLTFSVEHMSNNRLQVALLTKNNIDCVATVRKNDDGTYYSNDFITFKNYAVTTKKSGIVINRIPDLKGLTIVIWQKAYKDLGKEFETVFSPDPPYNSPYFDRQYREVASQENQNRMFWAGRAQVIIVDKTIFEYYRKSLASEVNTSEEVEYHAIFPGVTSFQVACREKKVRDDFDEGLKSIKENGIYRRLVETYIR